MEDQAQLVEHAGAVLIVGQTTASVDALAEHLRGQGCAVSQQVGRIVTRRDGAEVVHYVRLCATPLERLSRRVMASILHS